MSIEIRITKLYPHLVSAVEKSLYSICQEKYKFIITSGILKTVFGEETMAKYQLFPKRRLYVGYFTRIKTRNRSTPFSLRSIPRYANLSTAPG